MNYTDYNPILFQIRSKLINLHIDFFYGELCFMFDFGFYGVHEKAKEKFNFSVAPA